LDIQIGLDGRDHLPKTVSAVNAQFCNAGSPAAGNIQVSGLVQSHADRSYTVGERKKEGVIDVDNAAGAGALASLGTHNRPPDCATYTDPEGSTASR